MSPVTQFIFDGTTWQNEVATARRTVSTRTTTTTSPYRPISVSSLTELRANLSIPASANLVMWPYSTPQAKDIDSVFKTLAANDILVLPEASMPYQISSAGGFVKDTRRWMEMARAKRGLVGMGPGTVVTTSASSFTQAPQATSAGGCQERIIGCATAGGYYGNFEMQGRSFGGVAYHALSHTKDDSIWERIYFNASWRGFRNSPGGESGAVSGLYGANMKLLNCEFECRDASGTRVGSSPYMFNKQSNVLVQDVYAHHSVAGMPTFWRVSGGTVRRVRSEHNGSAAGALSGSAFNFELCVGTILIDSCTMICDYKTPSNSGMHIATNSGEAPATFKVKSPSYDAGPYHGVFAVDVWPTYGAAPQTQKAANVSVVAADGTPIPFRVSH
jgi:hypothetical protein